MRRRSARLAGLLIVCGAALLLVYMSFNWYLKRADRRLDEQIRAGYAADESPSPLDVKVPIPEELRSALEKPQDFHMGHRVSDITNPVKIAFARAIQGSPHDEGFAMAEPGAWPWNATDVIREGLPRRRLKAVATNNSLCLLFYEHGGLGKTDDIAVFRLHENEARAIWHSTTTADVTGPADLRAAIHGKTYGDGSY
jgi:hypothetical protein